MSLPKEDPRLPIRNLFARVGWAEVLNPKSYYCARIVRLFYCNLKRKDTCNGEIAIKSYFRGNRVRLSPTLLAAAFQLPSSGSKWEFTNDQSQLAKFVSPNDLMNTICLRTVMGNRQPKSTDLTPVAHVLLNLINTNVLPRGRNRDSVPPGYAYVLYCLVKGIPLSLPHILISYMVYCTLQPLTPLICPYPHLITALVEKSGLDMHGLEMTGIKSKFDCATLSRLRL